MQFIDYLLYGDVGVFQHILGLQDDEGIYPFRAGFPADVLDEFRKILGRHAHLVGIEGHTPFAVVILGYQLEELLQHQFRPEGGAVAARARGGTQLFLPDGTGKVEAGGHYSAEAVFHIGGPQAEQVVGEVEILHEDAFFAFAHHEAGIVQYGYALVEKAGVIHPGAGKKVAGNRYQHEMSVFLYLVCLENPGYVAGDVDDDGIVPYLIGFQVDLDFQLAFDAEQTHIAVEAAGVLEYVQHAAHLGVACLGYKEVV